MLNTIDIVHLLSTTKVEIIWNSNDTNKTACMQL